MTTQRTTVPGGALEELLVRVEKATGPDRELDWLVAAQVGEVEQRLTGDSPIAITASIDAALALVEKVLPGWWLESLSDDVSADADGTRRFIGATAELANYASDRRPHHDVEQGQAVTRSLAILAATIRALLANTEAPHD